MDKGNISVQTEHIFPIIKRWLYSDKDIFLREIVSNACDAITKLKHLSAIGQAENIGDDFKVFVNVSEKKKTLTVSDNGIGMSEDEVRKYINQIALSGALEFIEKYDNGKQSQSDGIIGHFGLGFYSSFMIADTVEINTKSFTDAPAVKWTGNEDGGFEMTESDRQDRGTSVTLYVTDDEAEYLKKHKITEILNKYCSFMPYPVYLILDDEETEDEPAAINDKEPLWMKNPSQCTEEEYEEFYHKVFNDYRKPLFHIHINADYPLNFKGILYFPRLGHEYESLEGEVKLYYNRVFVADNIKEVIPEYLLMLKGILDCPELPLNVSRSFLQSDAYVKRVSQHIVKKVCDKLNSLKDTEFEEYKSFWDDIKTFVEYACIRDKKFYEKTKDAILFKTTENEYLTLKEYLDTIPEGKDKTVVYATDVTQQAVYIDMFKNEGVTVVVLDKFIDNNFITMLEQAESGIKFVRVDASAELIKNEGSAEESTALTELFKKASGKDELKVEFTSLKDERIPAILNIAEESRRFAEMMQMYTSPSDKTAMPQFPEEATLLVNTSNSLIKKLGTEEATEKTEAIAKQIYTLALLNQRKLTADELSDFLQNSYRLLEDL